MGVLAPWVCIHHYWIGLITPQKWKRFFICLILIWGKGEKEMRSLGQISAWNVSMLLNSSQYIPMPFALYLLTAPIHSAHPRGPMPTSSVVSLTANGTKFSLVPFLVWPVLQHFYSLIVSVLTSFNSSLVISLEEVWIN